MNHPAYRYQRFCICFEMDDLHRHQVTWGKSDGPRQRFRFTSKAIFKLVFAVAVVLSLYVGRCDSLARFAALTEGLGQKFKSGRYPLTAEERQLTVDTMIPERNWIVMSGNLDLPNFWNYNQRNFEIGTGTNHGAMTCEIYFTVSQSNYALFSNPSIAIEYFPDDLVLNQQLANWFRRLLKLEYGIDATIAEFKE
ncbi:MAG: hypothetical protein AAF623_04685 [Planctomycetota bacterium]